MEQIVVVGGGIAGLIASDLIDRHGNSYCGIERSEVLGGDLAVGHHRFYDDGVVNFFSGMGVPEEWRVVDETPEELKKGKLSVISANEFTEGQRYFLGARFMLAQHGYGKLIGKLIDRVGRHYHLRRVVKEIELARKVIRFVDETEFAYGRLIWCQSLDSLFKAVKGERSDAFVKNRKSQSEEEGGVVLDMQFKGAFIGKENTVVLPFRYKEDVYRAFGNRNDFDSDGVVQFSWTIFLDETLLENHEEVAKCVRAFKRELFKQVPQTAELLVRERIIFLPLISSGIPVDVKKLELFPSISYLGPEVRLNGSRSDLYNLDLLIENCRYFASEIGLSAPSLASTQAEMGRQV